MVAACVDPRFGGLQELPLRACKEIWGWNPPELQPKTKRNKSGQGQGGDKQDQDKERAAQSSTLGSTPQRVENKQKVVRVRGVQVMIPRVPKKYIKFLRARASFYREISNMAKLASMGGHRNGKLHCSTFGFVALLKL